VTQSTAGETPFRQLRLVWPEQRLAAPPAIAVPDGYALRTAEPGDEARFFEVMDLAGWPGWDAARLGPWAARLLPAGWLVAVHRASNTLVASAMALRDCAEFGVEGGELGWLAADPAHTGKHLGTALSAAVTARFVAHGYRHIHLYTEDWRLAALKTYLALGYVPYLYAPEMPARWRAVCAQLAWPYTPEAWKA
jgi:mycothiol synthase